MAEDVVKSLAQSATKMLPQEEMAEVKRKNSNLFIGIPKETSLQEKRVPLVPQDVELLVNNGHQVMIESKAGEKANFDDHAYSEAGATIAYSREEVYKADILLKVEPLSHNEIDLLQHRQTLISALQLPVQPKNFLQKLIDKRVTAIAYDFIKDTSDRFPVIRAMSEIAGNTSILIAAEYLSNVNGGHGHMLGGISGVKPTEVVIFGAGAVAEFAARSALGLGASVKVFSNNTSKLRRLQEGIGCRVYTSTLQPKVIESALRTADVAIGAIRSETGRSPIVVTEEMVKQMQEGSVIVDVSIDQGGCFETSKMTNHSEPTYELHGVTHYCVPNIASRVARTASYALSNILAPVILDLGEGGGVDNCIKNTYSIRSGIYLYRGMLTNRYLAEMFNLPYKDLDLLLAAI
ncbi:MAG: alanine dehydrogenase [Flavobacteriales bacterium]|nr:alanine dehydrogenase [Flavobacteriales bacterium]|tara:strand:+ start:16300 stop:17517 length:1218 start_codon:yes stop_codon:yes gene_type:complete